MSKDTLIKFLEWMNDVTLETPMRLETDNEDIALMFLDAHPEFKLPAEEPKKTAEEFVKENEPYFEEYDEGGYVGIDTNRLIEYLKKFTNQSNNSNSK